MKHRRPPSTARAAQLRTDLRRCVIDGFFYCVMLGVAEMYFAKFVLALGLGPLAAGLIATVPMVLGAASGVPGQWVLRRVGAFNRFIGGMAAMQAVLLIPLAVAAFGAPFVMPRLKEAGLSWVMTLAVFAVTTCYFMGSLGGGPAWITITGAIFPARIRSNYFAMRSRLLQAGTLGGLLAHGFIADMIERGWKQFPALGQSGLDPVLASCGVAFLIASGCRFVSAWHLWRYTEPTNTSPGDQRVIPAGDFLRRFSHGNDGRFILYALAGGFALQIAQPYFNPFMLERVRYSGALYGWVVTHLGNQAPYSLLLAAVFLGRVLALPAAGRLSSRTGARRLLWIGGGMLPPMALFWLWTSDYGLLLLGQIATGVALAIWELGVFLMSYESVAPHERTAMITYFTCTNEAGKTTGSLLGAGLLGHWGKDDGAYAGIFWVSAVARLLTLTLLLRVRPTHPMRPHERADIQAAEDDERLTVG